ncbi:hypothetical protein LC593_20270 [Nostoc sp. CHAB 5844]|nr:hypothetical protein [Nostoc sp. CHAB 5844]
MHNPDPVQVGDHVLIFRPAYVTGKIGVVCRRESNLDTQGRNRWLIQVDLDTETIIVSLTSNDFQVINLESS